MIPFYKIGSYIYAPLAQNGDNGHRGMRCAASRDFFRLQFASRIDRTGHSTRASRAFRHVSSRHPV